eukprot:scaffold1060_cov196-Amphora_coffeaeformis.AAC.33
MAVDLTGRAPPRVVTGQREGVGTRNEACFGWMDDGSKNMYFAVKGKNETRRMKSLLVALLTAAAYVLTKNLTLDNRTDPLFRDDGNFAVAVGEDAMVS